MTYPVAPLKRVLSRNDGGVWGEEPAGLADSPVLRSTDQSADGHWLEVEPAMRSLTLSERAKARLFAGDLLLTKSSGSAQHIGKTTLVTEAIAELKPAFSNFTQRLRVSSENSPAFYWYCFRSTYIRDQLNLISTTTTGLANLTASTIGDLLVPVPQTNAQRRIADYLDAQTAKIDALIVKQEQLIETLAERRQAVIADEIAKITSARRVPLKYLYTPSKEANSPDLQVLSVYRDHGVILKASRTDNFNKTPDDLSRYLLVRPGDLVVNKMKAWQGSLGVASDTGVVSPDYEVLRLLSQHLESRFVHHLLRSPKYISEYGRRSVGIRPSQWRLYWDQLGAVRVPIPSMLVQHDVSNRIDLETSQIDALSAKAREMIDILRERRQALISAAVTGKIDVRGLT